MDIEKLDHEIEQIQKTLANTDPTSEDYKDLISRLKEIEELKRYSNHEDPETLKIEVEESEGKKNRKSATVLKVLGLVGMGVLMGLSHLLSASQIMERADERLIDKFSRDK